MAPGVLHSHRQVDAAALGERDALDVELVAREARAERGVEGVPAIVSWR